MDLNYESKIELVVEMFFSALSFSTTFFVVYLMLFFLIRRLMLSTSKILIERELSSILSSESDVQMDYTGRSYVSRIRDRVENLERGVTDIISSKVLKIGERESHMSSFIYSKMKIKGASSRDNRSASSKDIKSASSKDIKSASSKDLDILPDTKNEAGLLSVRKKNLGVKDMDVLPDIMTERDRMIEMAEKRKKLKKIKTSNKVSQDITVTYAIDAQFPETEVARPIRCEEHSKYLEKVASFSDASTHDISSEDFSKGKNLSVERTSELTQSTITMTLDTI